MLVDVPGFTRSPTINMELKISDIIYASAFQKCGLEISPKFRTQVGDNYTTFSRQYRMAQACKSCIYR